MKLKFSGHETFPLKFGWLKKVYDICSKFEKTKKPLSDAFIHDTAISDFGVGKNMVNAIKHWAIACKILEKSCDKDARSELRISKYGNLLFGVKGIDPYLENADSIWLLHWLLASDEVYGLYYYLFNFHRETFFSKKSLIRKLKENYEDQSLSSDNILERDFDTLIQSYTSSSLRKIISYEELIESPFSELSLINEKSSNEFSLDYQPKESLSNNLFLFALCEFWSNKNKHSTTLNMNSIHLDAGSPGQVFCMKENEIGNRLVSVEMMTEGKIKFGSAAGLYQVQLSPKTSLKKMHEYSFNQLMEKK